MTYNSDIADLSKHTHTRVLKRSHDWCGYFLSEVTSVKWLWSLFQSRWTQTVVI